MPVTVTLNIYTCNYNPVWQLDVDQINELRSKFTNKNRTTTQRPQSVFGVLGFGGFDVSTFDEPKLPPKFHLGLDIVDFGDFGHGLVIDGSEEMQISWVKKEFSEKKGLIARAIVDEVESDVAKRKEGLESSPVNLPISFQHDTPWNFNEYKRLRNNCYNYATNKMVDSYSQPGRYRFQSLHEPLETLHTVEGAHPIINKAMNDGLELLPFKTTSELDGFPLETGQHIAALFHVEGDNKHDYHWYRQDRPGEWSHKMGDKLVRNTDEKGKLITDPLAADRASYTKLGGFFLVDDKKVNVI